MGRTSTKCMLVTSGTSYCRPEINYTECEKLHARTSWDDRRAEIKVYSQATICRKCVFAVALTIEVGWLRLEIKNKYRSVLRKLYFVSLAQTLGLTSQVTEPHTSKLLSMGLYEKRSLLFALLPVSLRRQQQSGKDLAFLNAHSNHCCVIVGSVLRSVAILLSVCSKLAKYNFFRMLQCLFLISRLSYTHFNGHRHWKIHIRRMVAWQQILVSVPSIASQSLGIEFFRSLHIN